MKKIFTFLAVLLLPALMSAQITQTIRGTVLDKESQVELIGVNVVVTTNSGETIGTITDEHGNFRLENVPLGRHRIDFTYLGYHSIAMNDIVVNSSKEVILNVRMEESITELVAVEVLARRNGEVSNEMAPVSAREFSVEETNRYAGSRGDPGRMASNFAGVQGADDSRNDIVIRGNSPGGVLWRLEGVNIPNPNHFAIPGTAGGPVTILNNKYLSNSDFFTGAFPAEYGNSIAGVFDLKMRNGNNEKHEFSAQLGFLGTELMAEGPISREKRSSYLVSYRYSTLSLFDFMGINIGSDAVPKYQDGAFRLNFPNKNGSNIALWGIGGYSDIDIILSDAEKQDTTTFLYGDNDRDQYFGSTMGVVGLTYTKAVNPKTFMKFTVSASKKRVDANHDFFDRDVDENGYYINVTKTPILDYTFDQNKYSAYFVLNKKFNKQSSLKAGINADLYHFNFIDSVIIYRRDSSGEVSFSPWQTRWKANASAPLIQPFVQYKYKMNEKLTFLAGVTALYFGINDNSFSPFEPRLGVTYQINKKQKISLGMGRHSQIQSPYLYYYGGNHFDENGNPIPENTGMGLTKSNHIVLSVDAVSNKNMRAKIETYYQQLSEVPVKSTPSSFSLINAGSGFSRLFPDTVLVNEGTGTNYGFEMTIEKFFSAGYYFLITGSVFDSKYKGSDGVKRNSTFNGGFAFNFLFAKEITVKGKSALNLGTKVTLAGGRWYGPVDRTESFKRQEIIFEDATFNTKKFKPYFRTDFKVNYRWNRPKVTHEFSVDLVNAFGIKNILKLSYAQDHPSGDPIREEYQLGFLPIFYYKIDF